jgi:hypothetical protein
MGGDASTLPFAVVPQTMIFADDLVVIDVPKTEGNAAVLADIASGYEGAIGDPVDYDTLIEQCHWVWLVYDVAGKGDGIPERR